MKTALYAFAAVALLAAPAAAQDMGAPMERSQTTPVITDSPELMADFGGVPGLTRIMDDFMVNLLADDRTRPFFEGSDQTRIKAQLVEQFCVIMNGGCTYSGRSMAEAHQGLNIERASFYALVEALQKSMNKYDVPFRSQNKLLAALASQHRDIVRR